jgi:hypothetical protein
MRTFKDAEKYDVAERLEREIPLWGATEAEVRSLFAPSQAGAEKHRDVFDGLETYCTFIGYPRSGHSIMGSLLDAHPNVIIAHELDALRFLEAGFSERQLYYLLLENSRLFTQHGRRWGQYSYAVPGQRQGKFSNLRVIGDNKGGRTTSRIGRDWRLLAKLRDTVRLQHRFIHVVRNPFDNIATLAMRQTGGDIIRAIEQYFFMCQTNDRLRRELGPQVLDFPHEDFLKAPTSRLAQLCEFVGVVGDESYLNACSEIVYRIPHKSRHEVAWPRGTREFIEREMAKYEFLRTYTYED